MIPASLSAMLRDPATITLPIFDAPGFATKKAGGVCFPPAFFVAFFPS
jgi:hypothetical protein